MVVNRGHPRKQRRHGKLGDGGGNHRLESKVVTCRTLAAALDWNRRRHHADGVRCRRLQSKTEAHRTSEVAESEVTIGPRSGVDRSRGGGFRSGDGVASIVIAGCGQVWDSTRMLGGMGSNRPKATTRVQSPHYKIVPLYKKLFF
jgi:hypothetical protein